MKSKSVMCLLGTVLLMASSQFATAATNFTASLTGDQEVNPVVTNASGTATLTLNDLQNSLSMTISLTGLDLDGNQTPGDDSDNVTGLHIHAAPAGLNGGVVFGLISPNNDLDGDLVIDPVAGTLTSVWDGLEGNGTTLADQLANLLSEGLYFNVHTVGHAPGEIRGQIVPEPMSLSLLGLGGLALLRKRRQV